MTLKGIFTRAATTDYFHQFDCKKIMSSNACLFATQTLRVRGKLDNFGVFLSAKKISRLFAALIFTQR